MEIAPVTDEEAELYYYSVNMEGKYLSMKFNDYIRVDGDPTGVDITVTWLRDITRSADMEVFYIVQTTEGEEIASKFFDLPSLCTGRYLYDSWDSNIMEIYTRQMTNSRCPIKSVSYSYGYQWIVGLLKEMGTKLLFILGLHAVGPFVGEIHFAEKIHCLVCFHSTRIKFFWINSMKCSVHEGYKFH